MHQDANTVAKRRAQLRGVAEAYFGALAKKDFVAIPYDDSVVLRAPLAPGGVHNPLVGKEAWSSPKYAVKSLSVHFCLCSAHFLDLLHHLLSMRCLPLVVLRHIEVAFACTPHFVVLCQQGPDQPER